ncbi:sigma-54-dependent Fis family transcriptional regulator [Alkalihalobacillus sp. TS-13]|uniref:sigma-54 interaction domain-containing protein n=1 Tax=Alkalihalobacillus sp. TS-13 TaxID=2842455 RepID=UPI001C86BD5D|nr:sigma 54-interacting transcriptional regulator [Alkalihalobacillus sp. TS-13]
MLDQLKYIDGITIIDTSGTILFTVKFNPRFHTEIDENEKIIGQNLFSAFPLLDERSSTLLNVMKTGKPIFRAKQSIVDFRGIEKETTNVSLPIKAHGKIIGSIELSMDISQSEHFPRSVIEIDSSSFDSRQLKKRINPERAVYSFEDIVTNDEVMTQLKESARKFASGDSSVFIYGETGTGKELFAHAIHNASGRSVKPYITQNCAALPESLIESILFGTKRGSFTGAEDNPGLFELADGGTLFLDEINSMPIHLQAKLLRVLEDGYVRRLGDTKLRKVDVRIITASNIHPSQCVRDGSLRQDLYFRLGVMTLAIPPLRERKKDIPLLVDYFVSKLNKGHDKNIAHISRNSLEVLLGYDWPGNVRELENVIEYALNQADPCEDTLQYNHLEQQIKHLMNIQQSFSSTKIKPLKDEIANLEKARIEQAILLTGGNVSKAARMLEIPRQTLQNKMNHYRIN